MSAWIVETLVATTILMVLVLLVRGHVAQMFGARIAYLLWLLPALRMILPPLPEAVGPTPIAQLPVSIDFALIEVAEVAPMMPDSGVAWGTLLFALWLGGAIGYFAWQFAAYRRFVGEALRHATQLPEMDRHAIEVSASKAVDGPFAAGVFVQKIVLPHDYRTRYTAEELRLAMDHETAHHRRGDLSINYLALAMLSLHWFNPVAHRAWRAFREDQELACDAIVLAGASGEVRHSYALALVKSTCDRTPVAACSLNPRDQLKLRLRMMRDGRAPGLLGRALAVMLVGGGLAVTASGGIAAETTREMETTMRSTVVEKTAMLHAAVAPMAAPMTQPAPAPAEYPVPAIAPAPVAAPAPAPVAWSELDEEAQRDAAELRHEALRDAEDARREGLEADRQARAEALREAEQARREGLAAAREARAEAHREIVMANKRDVKCNSKERMMETRFQTHDGGERRTATMRVCVPKIDQAEIQQIRIEALAEARSVIATSDEMTADQRRHAIGSIDVQMARLKGETH